jgi:copper chaperone CopZ
MIAHYVLQPELFHGMDYLAEIYLNYETIKIEEDIQMEIVIQVEGMMCKHCKAHVEKACKSVPGTVDAVVDLQAKNVTVTGSADVAALKAAITEAGYDVVE